MKKRALIFFLALLGLTAATLGFLCTSTTGLRLGIRLAGRLLPGDLALESVQGSLAEPIRIAGLSYHDQDLLVTVREGTLSWRPAALLHRTLDIRSLGLNGVSLQLDHREAPSPAAPAAGAIPLPFTFPLEIRIEKGTVHSLDLFVPRDATPVHLATLSLHHVRGAGTRLQIGSLAAAAPPCRFRLAGTMETGESVGGRFTVDSACTPPDSPPWAGRAEIAGTLAELGVTVQLTQPFPGTIRGSVTGLTDELRWQGELRSGPVYLAEISRDWPAITLDRVTAAGSGTRADYSLQAEATGSHGPLSEVHLRTRIDGDASMLQFADARIVLADATLSGQGRLAWRDAFTWQISVKGEAVNPAPWLPEWPGRLNFQLRSSGRAAETGSRGDLEIVSLAGTLRDYPLTASGRVELDGDNLEIRRLSLRSAGSDLRVAGRYGDRINIDAELQSSDLASLWPGAAGSIRAKGRLTGNRQHPVVQFDLTGEGLALEELRLGQVSAAAEADLAPAGLLQARLQASGVALGNVPAAAVNARLQGTTAAHRLQTEITAGAESLRLEFAGGIAAAAWQGNLAGADLRLEHRGDWHLLEPVPVAISAQGATVDSFCLTGTDAARVCLAGTVDREGLWQAAARIDSLPLHLLYYGQPQPATLEGTVAGNLDLAGDRNGIRDGTLRLATGTASLSLMLVEGERQRIAWQRNSLQADLADGQLTATLHSLLSDGSSIAASLQWQDLLRAPLSLSEKQMQGTLAIDLKELQPWAALTYPAVDPRGALQGEITLRGTLAQPRFTGKTQLMRGRIMVPPLGITLDGFEITLDGRGPVFRVTATGSSGEGSVHVAGDLRLGDAAAPSLTFTLRGDRFEAANLPELRLLVSPDLRGTLTRDRGEISGTILVPEAIIAPRDLAGTVTPSKDVVLLDAGKAARQGGWSLAAHLTILAGEAVRVDAFGLDGRVEGRLAVTALPGKPATGEGMLTVADGTFSIYGRELAIKDGRLLYSGNPLDNPGVDVRAEHTSREGTTGIQVTGFLAEPEISFYSSPPMEESAIISRLLTDTSLLGNAAGKKGFLGKLAGRTGLEPLAATLRGVKESLRLDEVKIESGQARDELSLVIGTWLTPELFISYGKNLLKKSGSFNTRYLLGQGFSLQTESGATQSGVDLKYEIDR